MATVPTQLYPFSTGDAQAIPVDVIKPVALVIQSITVTDSSFTVDASYEIAVFTADKDTLVSFGGAASIVDGSTILDALFIPAGCSITSTIPSPTIHAKTLAGSGTLAMQIVQKWAALGLNLQFVRQ